MWIQYRRWKHALAIPLVILAGSFMRGEPEMSPLWCAGLSIAAFLGLAYLAEEIVWMTKRQGRPCGHCGLKFQMQSFRLRTTCPHCGQPAE